MCERTGAPRGGGPDAAQRLWRELRRRRIEGCRFRRRHPIGVYFVDFACPERRLVVEIDQGPGDSERDEYGCRTQDIEAMGYRVIRFRDHEVRQKPQAVLEAIRLTLRESTARDGAAGSSLRQEFPPIGLHPAGEGPGSGPGPGRGVPRG